jgi:hypothetical protein
MNPRRSLLVLALVAATPVAWGNQQRAEMSRKNLQAAVQKRLSRDGKFTGYLTVDPGQGGRKPVRAYVLIGPGTYNNTPENVQASGRRFTPAAAPRGCRVTA